MTHNRGVIRDGVISIPEERSASGYFSPNHGVIVQVAERECQANERVSWDLEYGHSH